MVQPCIAWGSVCRHTGRAQCLRSGFPMAGMCWGSALGRCRAAFPQHGRVGAAAFTQTPLLQVKEPFAADGKPVIAALLPCLGSPGCPRPRPTKCCSFRPPYVVRAAGLGENSRDAAVLGRTRRSLVRSGREEALGFVQRHHKFER